MPWLTRLPTRESGRLPRHCTHSLLFALQSPVSHPSAPPVPPGPARAPARRVLHLLITCVDPLGRWWCGPFAFGGSEASGALGQVAGPDRPRGSWPEFSGSPSHHVSSRRGSRSGLPAVLVGGSVGCELWAVGRGRRTDHTTPAVGGDPRAAGQKGRRGRAAAPSRWSPPPGATPCPTLPLPCPCVVCVGERRVRVWYL